MHPLLRALGPALLFSASAASAQERPLNPDELENAAKFIVAGRVERVYSSENPLPNEQADTLYAIELKVSKVLKVDGDAAGKTIFVKAWKAAKRPDGWKGPKGQIEVPARGDLVEMHLTGGPAAFDALAPNGIRIVHAGSQKSKSIGLEQTLIAAGEFRMGAPGTEMNRRLDEPEHRVKITKPFYLGTYEVTQEEYAQVMQVNPSAFSANGGSKDKVAGQTTNRYPVELVSWFDAVEFCNRLSKKDGFEPYYTLADAKQPGVSIASASATIAGGSGYRLPTEAEWEYACRAGTIAPFHYGNESTARTSNVKALIDASGYGTAPKWKELGRTTKVGSFPANAWGLFDMHGNAAEWCEDWYDRSYYSESPREDPKGPVKGTHKVLRGGSWLVNDASCRAASRFFHLPSETSYYGGFRVARTP